MPHTRRCLLAHAVGLAYGVLVWSRWHGRVTAGYYLQQWFAGRALLAGTDPYAAVASHWPWPYFYPATAATAVLPLAALPPALAGAIFVALGTGALAYAITRKAWWPLLWLGSASVAVAALNSQWAPVFVAGALIPALAGFWIAKPTVGLALAAAYPDRRMLAGALLIGLVSLGLRPSWPMAWLEVARGDHAHLVPAILRPGGFLLLAALLRWRDPRARLLAVLALVPTSSILAESTLLGLVPRTGREMALLTACTWLAWWFIPPQPPDAYFATWMAACWWPVFACIYLPALALILLRPPGSPASTSPS